MVLFTDNVISDAGPAICSSVSSFVCVTVIVIVYGLLGEYLVLGSGSDEKILHASDAGISMAAASLFIKSVKSIFWMIVTESDPAETGYTTVISAVTLYVIAASVGDSFAGIVSDREIFPVQVPSKPVKDVTGVQVSSADSEPFAHDVTHTATVSARTAVNTFTAVRICFFIKPPKIVCFDSKRQYLSSIYNMFLKCQVFFVHCTKDFFFTKARGIEAEMSGRGAAGNCSGEPDPCDPAEKGGERRGTWRSAANHRAGIVRGTPRNAVRPW